jgi:guanylate kinase
MVEQGAFAEWAEVHGNRYGTAIETLEHWREQGCDVLLDIDIQGAAQLRKAYGEGVFIFILPPDLKELRKRLENRQTDDAEVIERRMKNARDEIRESVNYDYVVVNDDFDIALDALKSIVIAEGCRTARVLPGLTEVFDLDI